MKDMSSVIAAADRLVDYQAVEGTDSEHGKNDGRKDKGKCK